MEVFVKQPELTAQLRIAAIRVWRQMPLGIRFKIAVHRMLAQIYKGIGEAIAVILAENGYDVPRDARGRVDVKDPAIAKLGSAIYQKIRGVVRNEADIEDIMADTFHRNFLEQKAFLKLRGDKFTDYWGWILTMFHNAARDFVKSTRYHTRQRSIDISAQDPDRPSESKKLEMIESHLQRNKRVPWERHPMWRKVTEQVVNALREFDRKEKAKRRDGKAYDFPTRRVFELMIRDGLGGLQAARRLVEEGYLEVDDPSQIKYALKNLKNRLKKVVQTVVKSIEDHDLLDSFFDALT